MAIRLSPDVTKTVVRQHTVGSHIVESRDSATALAYASTEEEAETARLAFERVLLPRFTADEAIAIGWATLEKRSYPETERAAMFNRGYQAGVRSLLEALAAAGVFVPDDTCHQCHQVGAHKLQCSFRGHVPQTMADKLDAAGIR